MKKVAYILLALFCWCTRCPAQSVPYLVDGFHGGVYGHYPLDSYTDYMSGLLEKFPEWSMCLEIEPETWDSVKVATPEAYRHFRNVAVYDGRVEFTNPSYAQPYCYNILGESIIRQFEYGIRKIHEHFPDVRFYTYAVEEPCFTSALPQILRGFGFRYASLKNPNTCWGGYAAAHGGELVNWIGPDGTSILASPRHSIEDLNEKDVWSTIGNGQSAEYFRKASEAGFKHPVGMCFQDAGWKVGPWAGYGVDAKNGVRYTTWKNYFENIAADVTPEDYVFPQEDVRGALVWGSQVMQRIGRSVRTAENDILSAEKMGTMAFMDHDFLYDRTAVDDAWRTLLLSQHHDSWIVPYNGLKGRGTWADWICGTWTVNTEKVAGEVIADAKASFRKDAGSEGWAVRVYNTRSTESCEVVGVELPGTDMRSPVLTDIKGRQVPFHISLAEGRMMLYFKATVPAYGYTTYKLQEGGFGVAAISPHPSSKVLENKMYRIEVDPRHGGVVKSIVLKEGKKRELVKKDELYFGEMRGWFCDEGRFRSSTEQPATSTLVEDNPFEKSLRICGTIASHPFVETITIREGDPMIHFDLEIDWKDNVSIGAYRQKDAFNNPERAFYDEDYKLNIYFPTNLTGPELYKNAPFDVCRSTQESTRFTNYHDIKHNVILNWVSLEAPDGNGFSLHSDHTTAYAYSPGKPLALTVQYSGDGLWGRDYRITGPTGMRFGILPHRGGWAEAEKADRIWNEPLICSMERKAELSEKSFIDTGECGLELSTAHLTDDGVLIRLYNACGPSDGGRVYVDSSFSGIREVDLNGTAVGEIILQDDNGRKSFLAKMPRFGFRTYILER